MKNSADFCNEVIESCDSTNNLCRILGEENYPHGSWVSARIQTNGRGRQGRGWISEPGNLFLSILLRDIDQNELSWMPHFASLLLCEAITAIAPYQMPQIKWPNDVGVFREKGFEKGAGILCEGVSSSTRTFLVLGIGVNCKTRVITDRETYCWGISADELRQELLRRFKEVRFNRLGDLESLKARYQKLSLLKKGGALQWYSLSSPNLLFTGNFESFGDFGELKVIRDDGTRHILLSEEVKISPMSGLT